jgi:dihydrofolate reductase/thymidylate synthase
MKDFSIIVACDEANGIGKNGLLPWHLPSDLKHFKEITTAPDGEPLNALIMGRKTWESIPEKFRPLPGRLNVVITSDPGYALPRGVLRKGSLEEAISVLCDKENKLIGKVFVIGGARVFSDAMMDPLCASIYLTRIYDKFDCDVVFPDIPPHFMEKDCSRKFEEKSLIFSFSTLVRITS